MQETWVQSLGQEDPLQKEMAPHSSTLARKIPWTEEPGGLQSTDGDCNREIKRHLCLEKKAMTNLDSILKRRDITLPTKFCLVKAMDFPVVKYGFESWIIKKAECRRIDAFNCSVGEDS